MSTALIVATLCVFVPVMIIAWYDERSINSKNHRFKNPHK